ncbi:MAG: hypothetical protein Q7K03_04955 [Dehalococcoidia bacterium]|nr:hypothetical protein [Dehalococcoidia bacterium]
MSLVDEAIKYLKGKPVIVVTSLESEDYLQEVSGVLLDGSDGCLVVQQEDEASPTIINAAFVAWIYEDTGEDEEEDENDQPA